VGKSLHSLDIIFIEGNLPEKMSNHALARHGSKKVFEHPTYRVALCDFLVYCYLPNKIITTQNII
jgi:hypothetical protein